MFTMFSQNPKLFLSKPLFKHDAKRFKQKYDELPRAVRKVYYPNPDKPKPVIPKRKLITPYFETTHSPRANKLKIQMLSRSIYKQVFPYRTPDKGDPVILESCLKNLEKHNMANKPPQFVPDVDFKVPPLRGVDIEDHFRIIGEEQAKPYRELVKDLLKRKPKPPDEWLLQPGWTRYAPRQKPESVPYPLEENLVFDIENCLMAGKSPTLATAVSGKAWYGWVSQSLVDGTCKPITSHHHYNMNSLIPLESREQDTGLNLNSHMTKPKIVIGHNVSYDRARIKEQYWLNRTGTRFLDTMSLHISISGLTSYQRALLKSKSTSDSTEDDSWKIVSSLNSLDEVHKLYCGKKLDKQTRNLFVEGTLQDIQENFQQVMTYCAGDVTATYDVLKIVFPLFLDRFTHPVTLAGILELSTAYLPLNSNWHRYVMDAEQAYDDLNIEGKILLARRADQACQMLHDDKYKQDLWLWDQDWKVRELTVKKAPTKSQREKLEEALDGSEKSEEEDEIDHKFRYLEHTRDLVSGLTTLLPGYPGWYKKLCTKPDTSQEWVPGPNLISTSMLVTPKLLCLTWEGYPLHYIKDKGWGFLIPFTDDLDVVRKLPLRQLLDRCPLLTDKPLQGTGFDEMSKITGLVEDNLMRKEYWSRLKTNKTSNAYKGAGVYSGLEVDDCCYFFKLPHKNGPTNNVGNPLAKDFLNKFSENVLAGDTENAEAVLKISRMLSYWKMNRARILDQMVVWLDTDNIPKEIQTEGESYGAIVPQVVVCGTLTRRAVEPTWMTASNANLERVGSELRAMVQAPPGYNIVGADVDSQELWIASVIGDAHQAKTHGATPLGWMTLSGTKADGTDMHSVTAKAVGISRDHAKVINYARIYGAGQNFAERLLKQFNPSFSDTEARSKAVKMFNLTKGKRIFYLKREFVEDYADQAYTKWQAFEIAKSSGKTVFEMFEQPKWVGGTESAMFNRLEAIANMDKPLTSFLNCRLSRALEPRNMSDDKYLPTRVNWVVQSGAVDFLHLMLVCMRWITGDKARFCLSFHDEIRYLVPEEVKYQAALAMHVTNLLTRAFCSAKLGIYDLPQSVAFFSAVEVDTVLRKDAKQDCATPSNPHGLEKGYGVKNGESVDIYEAVKKAAGQYTCWYERLQK